MSARSFVLNKKSQGNILVEHNDNGLVIRLHGHKIIEKVGHDLKISSCGYMTVTTKRAINRYFHLASLPLSLYQKKGEWFLFNRNLEKTVPFNDGMIVPLTKVEMALSEVKSN